jgi:hypothetical protein
VSGYVVRLPQEAPSGVIWDAIIASPHVGQDQLICDGVALDEAKRAIEQHAIAPAAEP